MPRIYLKDKELVEQYRLDRLKVDQIENQFVNQKESLETLTGFLQLYFRTGMAPIVNLYGKTGIGKTWILKHFVERMIKDKGIKHVFLDVSEYANAFSIMKSIMDILSMKHDFKFERFKKLLQEIQLRIADNMEAKVGTFFVDNSDIPNIIYIDEALENTKQTWTSKTIKIGKTIDLAKLQIDELYKVSPIVFAQDIIDNLSKTDNKLILLFDGYNENIINRELIPLLIAALKNVFFVISTDKPLDWIKYSEKWRDPSKFLKIEIQPLGGTDIDKYVEKRIGVSTEEILESIIDITKGFPLLIGVLTDHLENMIYKGVDPLDYLEQLKENIKSNEIENYLISKFLESLSEDDKELLKYLSLFDWLDLNILRSILPPEKSENTIDNFIVYSIVEPKHEIYDAWKIHTQVLDHIRRHFSSSNFDNGIIDKMKNQLYRQYSQTKNLYYLLEYLSLIRNFFNSAFTAQIDDLINEIYYETSFIKANDLYNWLVLQNTYNRDIAFKFYFAKLLETMGLDNEASNIYTTIMDDPNISEILKIRARRLLSNIYFLRKAYDDVINILKVNVEKLSRLPFNAETLLEKMYTYHTFMKTYFLKGNYEKALEFYHLMCSFFDETEISPSMIGERNYRLIKTIKTLTLGVYARILGETEPEKLVYLTDSILSNYLDVIKNESPPSILIRTMARTIEYLVNKCIGEGLCEDRAYELADMIIRIWNTVDKIEPNDPATYTIISKIFSILGDYFQADNDREKSITMYKYGYSALIRCLERINHPMMIISLSEIAPKYAMALMRIGDRKTAFQILVDSRDRLEKLLRITKSKRIIWNYYNVLRYLGKIYHRADNYTKAASVIKKSIDIIEKFVNEYGIQSVEIFDYIDSLKDMFRAYLRIKDYEAAIKALNHLSEIYKKEILGTDKWKSFDAINILYKIMREIRRHLDAPGEYLETYSRVLFDLLQQIYDKIIRNKTLPENPSSAFQMLTWITTSLAKLWYSLSLFEDLMNLLNKTIELLDLAYELSDENHKPEILAQKFRVLLRRAVVRFFAELDIENVEADLDACRKIVAELEGKYDEVELTYMKSDLILFDGRVKNQLKQFEASITNLRDFISILAIIPSEKINTNRMREIFDRAFKVLRDIRILGRRQLSPELKAKLKEVEKELKQLKYTIFK